MANKLRAAAFTLSFKVISFPFAERMPMLLAIPVHKGLSYLLPFLVWDGWNAALRTAPPGQNPQPAAEFLTLFKVHRRQKNSLF